VTSWVGFTFVKHRYSCSVSIAWNHSLTRNLTVLLWGKCNLLVQGWSQNQILTFLERCQSNCMDMTFLVTFSAKSYLRPTLCCCPTKLVFTGADFRSDKQSGVLENRCCSWVGWNHQPFGELLNKLAHCATEMPDNMFTKAMLLTLVIIPKARTRHS